MKHNRWFPLAGVTTVPHIQKKLKTLYVDRIHNELPVLKQTPKFSECLDRYLAYFDTVKDAKRPAP